MLSGFIDARMHVMRSGFLLFAWCLSASSITYAGHGLGDLFGSDACDSAASEGLNVCNDQSCWYAYSEAIFFNRDNRSNVPSVLRITDEGNALPGTTILSSRDLKFDFEPGARLLFGWRRDAVRAIEFSYFGIYDWNAQATTTGANDLAIPSDLGLASLDFFAADRMELQYKSQLNNAEANYVRDFGQRSLLTGFRWLSLHENFNINSTDTDSGTSDYNIRTTNNLFGGQIGLRQRYTFGKWGCNITGKSGIFGNAAEQAQSVTDFPPGFLLRDRAFASGGQVAFVGDLNLTTTYRLTRMLEIRSGYNLLWSEGLALAPNQLDFTDTATSGTGLDTRGGLFAHGVSIGLEGRW
jgi:hypothetical protein